MTQASHLSRAGRGRQGRFLKIETGPPLRLLCRQQHDGGGMLFGYQVLLYTPLTDRDPMLTEILRNAIPQRYRLAVSQWSRCSWATTEQLSRWKTLRLMKNEKLKSTTVRFTESDLYLIESLQEKLGLGMIHIIRLAIRRFAESENLPPSNSVLGKRQ